MMKITKQIAKRASAMFLALIMVLSMTGCGEKKEDVTSNNTEGAGEYAYIPEWHNLVLQAGGISYSYNYIAANNSRIYLCRYSYGGKVPQQSLLYFDVENPDNMCELVSDFAPQEEETQSNVASLLTDKESNLFVVYTRMPVLDSSGYPDWDTYWEEVQKKQEFFLRKYSPEGEILFEKDLTEALRSQKNTNFSGGAVDENGNLFLVNNGVGIIKLDKEGNFVANIPFESEDWISGVNLLPDGKIGLSFQGRTTELRVLNPSTNEFEKSISSLPPNCMNAHFITTKEGNILISCNEGLYEMNLQTEEYEQILKWLDCDINGNYVQNTIVTSAGDILLYYYDWDSNKQSLILLKRTDKNEVVEKKTLTIGCFYTTDNIQGEVVDFNKSNSEYRIEIKDYAANVDWSKDSARDDYKDAVNRFKMDLLSDNAPDMFVPLSGYVLDINNLVEKGAVEDLTPYLEKSTKFSKEDFFESVLSANTHNGVLYALPKTFQIDTMFARTEDVGEKNSLTMQDLKELCDKHPGATIFANATAWDVLTVFLSNDMDSYINMETGECFFEGQDFKDLLEICKKHPMEFSGEPVSEPKAIREGSSFLYRTTISDADSYNMAKIIFGCPVTNIGYPTSSPGGGMKVYSNGLCISSSSKYKDVCFAFIEHTLAEENVLNWNNYGLPAQKALFDKTMEESCKRLSGRTWSWGDVTIEVPVPTKEDCEEIKEMIQSIETVPILDTELIGIIQEEAEAYFEDQKSLDEVTKNIQSRVKLYLSEKQ